MLIQTVVSPLLGSSCYLLSQDDGSCVVVDPGFGVTAEVVARVRDARLTPVAVLATHGHVDHTWSAAAVCSALGVPLHLHRADVPRVEDPFGTLGPLGAQLAQMAHGLGERYEVPASVVPFDDRAVLSLRAVDGTPFPLETLHAPGHTEGSTCYALPGVRTLLTGDVLFAGTIGRTDLPGGDPAAMSATLARLAAVDPGTTVLPGHGEPTTIAAELATNPYLRAAGGSGPG